MDIKINLGSWNSVFAVPCDVVDKHIKLAGAAQLKVLLWILRNAGKNFTADDIASDLSMHRADVKDCVQFWKIAGLISINESEIVPGEAKPDLKPLPEKEPVIPPVQQRPQSRAQRPDSDFVAKRINGDLEIAGLMQEAELILGRPLSGGDTSTLLMLHDTDGLPASVILMLLQFAVSSGKSSIRYIEKVGISWAAEEIFSVELAEQKITEINNKKSAWNKVSACFGIINSGAPTKAQVEYADRWLNEYKMPIELLKEAYEICVNTKGQYNLKYIDGIIKKWDANGIRDLSSLQRLREQKSSARISDKKQPTQNEQNGHWQNKSFDLSEIEGKDIFSK